MLIIWMVTFWDFKKDFLQRILVAYGNTEDQLLGDMLIIKIRSLKCLFGRTFWVSNTFLKIFAIWRNEVGRTGNPGDSLQMSVA